ncbi:MAG: UPF0175 family protein [Nanoarchaeota archaeon]|nr:UPF0175 family protein [Nanoarchaeota archaeon]
MTATVTTRIDESLLKEVDLLSTENQMDRATFLRNLIKKGVENEKRHSVLEEYREQKISLQKSAEKLNLSVLDMIDIICKENLTIDYSDRELKEDLKGI